jgi:hypothetical protein
MPGIIFHLYCSICECYLTCFEKASYNSNISGTCPSCTEPYESKSLNNGNCFLTISMKEQLKSFLENPGNQKLLRRNSNLNSDGSNLSDILSGSVYKQHSVEESGFLSNSNNYSYTFNTDGAQAYNHLHLVFGHYLLIWTNSYLKRGIQMCRWLGFGLENYLLI